MEKLSLTKAKRYLSLLKASKAKYETRETFANVIGLYPEVIAADLAWFDPIVNIDFEYDLKLLIPALAAYVETETAKSGKKAPVMRISQRQVGEYASLEDFIYRKMTIGSSGIVNKNAQLSDKDLKILKRLINAEQKARKEEK